MRLATYVAMVEREPSSDASMEGVGELPLTSREREVITLLNTNASPVNDEKGRRRGAVLVMEDVTERRRRERQLRNWLGALDLDSKGRG